MTLEMKLREAHAEGKSEGKAEGVIKILSSLVEDKLISLSEAAKRSGLSEAEFTQRAKELSK